jgi:hypothetical protein
MSASEIKPIVSAVALQFRLAGTTNDGGERYTASEKGTGRHYSVSKAGGQDPAEEVWVTAGSGSGEISKTANKAAAFMAAENDARIALHKALQAMRSAKAALDAEQLRMEIEAQEQAEREKEVEETDAVDPTDGVTAPETPMPGETPPTEEPAPEDEPATGGETPPDEDEDDTGGSGGSIIDILV